MRTNKDIGQRLEQKDVDLLDRIISRLNQMLSWEMSWGLLGSVDTYRAKLLITRLRARRQKDGQGLNSAPINDAYESDKRFYSELKDLLAEFVKRDGLGVEYDKRLAQKFTEITINYWRKAREE